MATGSRAPFGRFIFHPSALASCLAGALLLPAAALAAPPPTPVASPGFTVTVFAGTLGRFDRSELHRDRRETRLGRLRQRWSPRWQRERVKGHNDGLRLDPTTNQLWALQNEDANPKLVVIDPITGITVKYTFAAKPPHGGGLTANVYFSVNPTRRGATASASVDRAATIVAGRRVEPQPVTVASHRRLR